jgi:hypothetical protein
MKPHVAYATVLGSALVGVIMAGSALQADEGMWLFTNPPRKHLMEKYNFDPTAQWLEHVQKSSVRFNSGGSGSFVSPDGLVMTNHHLEPTACKSSAIRNTTTSATASMPRAMRKRNAASISN